jgi:acyl-coenzyme A synthetase/AMP-(fatty) acid ligase
VIREIHDCRPLAAVLADGAPELPPGLPVLGEPPEAEAEAPVLKKDADEPFLELFTGGSTGTPRLWSKTPANLFGEAFYLADRFGIGPGDRILATVPPVHIYGLLFSVLLPLVTGARVVEAMPSFPAEIASALRESRATVLVSVPVHYRVLRTVSLAGHGLRRAFSSGGMLEAADGLPFHEETGVGITEVYGSTETGGIAFRNRVDDGPCWHPFDVVDWRIDGELLRVRSPFLSPEMERDADGFAATGDRVEAAGARSFDLLGRMDGIVKIGGKRVDLREVMEKLKGLGGVEDAHVTTLPVGTGRQQEVAALVVSGRGDHELKAALEAVLEPPARPRVLRVVHRIPVLATGKPDRARIEEILRHGEPDDRP